MLGKLTVVLKAVDKASPTIKKVRQETAGLGKEAQKTSLGTMVLGGALIGAGTASLYMASKFAQSAADVEALTRGFNELTKGSTLSLEALKKATGGTVSEIDLLRAANQAMMLGIDAKFLPEVFEIARKSAAAMGIDASYAIESVTRGIGRQSIKLLDNLGIWFSASEANREYAETLGKNVDELTDAERKQAFLNKALKAGREHVARLGDITGGATEAYQQFSATLEDCKSTIGEHVLPVVRLLLGGLKGLFGLFKSLPKPMKSFIVAAGLVVSSLAVLGGAFLILKTKIIASTIALAAFQALSGPTGWAILAIGTAATIAATLWINSMTDMGNATEDAASSIMDSFEDIDEEAQRQIAELGNNTVEGLKRGLLDRAQKVVEDFEKCAGGKAFDLTGDFETAMNDLVTNTNNLIKAGLLGQAQANMAAFAECTVSKEADMVDQIEEYLDELYEEYQDNTNKIAVLTKAGKEDEAAIYEEANQNILAKMEQFETWKQAIIAEGEEEIKQILGDSSDWQTEAEMYLQDETLRILKEAHDKKIQEMREFGKQQYQEYVKQLEEMEAAAAATQAERQAALARIAERGERIPAHLQYGGIVRHPTLAMIAEREPEIVMPLSRLRKSATGFRGIGGFGRPVYFSTGPVTVHVHGDIRTEADEDRLAKKIAQRQLDEMRAAWT